jgi:hypothetical protein
MNMQQAFDGRALVGTFRPCLDDHLACNRMKIVEPFERPGHGGARDRLFFGRGAVVDGNAGGFGFDENTGLSIQRIGKAPGDGSGVVEGLGIGGFTASEQAAFGAVAATDGKLLRGKKAVDGVYGPAGDDGDGTIES